MAVISSLNKVPANSLSKLLPLQHKHFRRLWPLTFTMPASTTFSNPILFLFDFENRSALIAITLKALISVCLDIGM